MINASFLLILEIRPAMLLLFHENEKIPDCLGNRNNINIERLRKDGLRLREQGGIVFILTHFFAI